MKPATDIFRSAMLDMFDKYAARANVNEKKALMLDYILKRGMLTGRQIAEAREFARLKEEDQ